MEEGIGTLAEVTWPERRSGSGPTRDPQAGTHQGKKRADTLESFTVFTSNIDTEDMQLNMEGSCLTFSACDLSKPAASLSFIDSCPRYGGRMVKLQESVGADARRSGRWKVDPSQNSYRPALAETSFLTSEENSTGSCSKKTHFHHIFRNLKNHIRHRGELCLAKIQKLNFKFRKIHLFNLTNPFGQKAGSGGKGYRRARLLGS